MRCIIHRWLKVPSRDGSRGLFTGKLITRHDRVCRDCGKMQISIEQFPKDKQRELVKLSKSCLTVDWVTFKEGDKVDKQTRRWLRVLDVK